MSSTSGGWKSLTLLALVVPVMLCAPGRARAELTLRPDLTLRLEYTDNLFLAEDDETSEVIGMLAPGIHLERTGRNMHLELGYAYEMYRYFNDPELNSRADAHIGSLTGALLPERSFSIGLSGEANRQVIDRRVSDGDDPLLVNTTNRITGQLRPVYRFAPFSRTRGELAYRYSVVYYEDPAADDTESHAGELRLVQGFGPRTDLQLYASYERIDAVLGQDYERYQGKGGLEWRPVSSVTLLLLGGRAHFEFEDASWDEVPLLETGLHYTPGPHGDWQVTYSGDAAYDMFDGVYETRQGTAAIALNGRLSWRLEGFYRDDDYLRVYREDRERAVGLEASYRLTQRTSLGVRGDKRWLEFAPVTEKVDRHTAGVSLIYTPSEHARVDLSYRFRVNDSDLDVHDYVENRVLLTISLGYALTPDGSERDVRGILQPAQ